MTMTNLQDEIKRLLPNGLGATGDEERAPAVYPARRLHVLVAASGSVASVKVPLIVRELRRYADVDVQVVATKSALHFFDRAEVEAEHRGNVRVWTDNDEWSAWASMGDPVLHIELRRWADIVLVAPCSANTLAKIAGGICDNILSSLLRALPTLVPVLLFPAMNTHMYNHPLTALHLKMAQDVLRYRVFGPVPKLLACGDMGVGAMTEWSDIVRIVVDEYRLQVHGAAP